MLTGVLSGINSCNSSSVKSVVLSNVAVKADLDLPNIDAMEVIALSKLEQSKIIEVLRGAVAHNILLLRLHSNTRFPLKTMICVFKGKNIRRPLHVHRNNSAGDRAISLTSRFT